MKPPAADRTAALFPDATPPQDRPKPAPKRVFWLEVRETNPTRWVTTDAYIERRPDGYLPFVHGQPQGIYPTMAAAATVAERVLSNATKPEVMKK